MPSWLCCLGLWTPDRMLLQDFLFVLMNQLVSLPTVFSAVPLNLVTRSPVFMREFVLALGLELVERHTFWYHRAPRPHPRYPMIPHPSLPGG
jgi:hypothetical protein